uniref:Uncharacterized protein n=1 Tax=Desulfatirhabdium butyrativorans TaxID=340467 RepID=A0A7C4W133_9BACT
MAMKLLAFLESPHDVRNAVGYLLGGWLSVYAFVAHIEWSFPGRFTQANVLRLLVVGIGICYCVLRFKLWARKMCIFFNIGVIGVHFLFLVARIAALGLTPDSLTVHALLNCVLFGFSTWFLIRPETASFFKELDAKAKADSDASAS